ncbi:MAG: hypothetical protein AB1742_13660 [bacterium]
MMIKTARLLLFSICAWAILPAFSTAQDSDWMVSSLLRFETHSDETSTAGGTDDDFIYHMLSFTKEIRPRTMGNFFYLYRYDVDNNDYDANILGANYVRLFKSYSFSASYFFSDDNRIARDQDRFLLAVNDLLHQYKNNSEWRLVSTYTTQTDWDEGQTITERLSYTFPTSDRSTLTLAYTYGYSFDIDHQIYNQYNIAYNYTYNKQMTLMLDYLFLGKEYSYLVGGVPFTPDDDNVFRLSMMYYY